MHLGSGLAKASTECELRKRSIRGFLAYQYQDRCVFIAALSKSNQDNISLKETRVYKGIARVYLSMNKKRLGTVD